MNQDAFDITLMIQTNDTYDENYEQNRILLTIKGVVGKIGKRIPTHPKPKLMIPISKYI